ncbi:MAG: helicase-related protein [Verrucomicrobiia bacterium]
MPEIYDNIKLTLGEGLRRALPEATSASFCVGYLNLRGWNELADFVDNLKGGSESQGCRLLIGMHRPPEEQMRELHGFFKTNTLLDAPAAARLKKKIVDSFKEQLIFGIPSNKSENALRHLLKQIKEKKVFIKSFLRYPLHAKLYLILRQDPMAPIIGFVGSSNLTLSGLGNQGELNVDVIEQDAAKKLLNWFEDRWNDKFALDITTDLAKVIEESWALKDMVRPYLVYLKIAYHLSEATRISEREFKLPKIFEKEGTPLLDFQAKAVYLAAHILYNRKGVLLGDVVGLGKTLMATAVSKILQEDSDVNTLIICPPKLKKMWERYLQKYNLVGNVLSLGRVIDDLPNTPRYRLLIIDESHNLCNHESKRYKAIKEYIDLNEPKVILLTATPFNKQYKDLSNQIRLFVDEDEDLHIRPERFFQQQNEQGQSERDFVIRYQTGPCTLRAFEESYFPEDWRDLMRLFLVRRTRNFIIRNYAKFDDEKKRYYVLLNGKPSYFPLRKPFTVKFPVGNSADDQYARLFNETIVSKIEELKLPRYGLGNYLINGIEQKAAEEEKEIIKNLTRAGRRLIGFCRTNLFKRLESSGDSFLTSIKRHIVRNLIYIYAIENNLPFPVGSMNPSLLDTATSDIEYDEEEKPFEQVTSSIEFGKIDARLTPEMSDKIGAIYKTCSTELKKRYDWIDSRYFHNDLNKDLINDTSILIDTLKIAGEWDPEKDNKLNELYNLITNNHPNDKILVFTQFADTADYLFNYLKRRGVDRLGVVFGDIDDPVEIACQFSPESNGYKINKKDELRVLITTDVLSEGQNLQDCHIVVNYDLPWAIIRLIQRAGRVDRIGQKHDTILVYSFLPADGVEDIINLRSRLIDRLKKNQEVIGTDESFFGEDAANQLRDLYTEKAHVLENDESDEDIDISSYALQIWNSASKEDRDAAKKLPDLVSSTAPITDDSSPSQKAPGVITFMRFPDGMDALVRVNENGDLVSNSLSYIFSSLSVKPDTPALPRPEYHYKLVEKCLEYAVKDEKQYGGALGSSRSVANKLYKRLSNYRKKLKEKNSPELNELTEKIDNIIDLIYTYSLKESARDKVSRQLRLGINDKELAEMVIELAEEEKLVQKSSGDVQEKKEPQIICSLGFHYPDNGQQLSIFH